MRELLIAAAVLALLGGCAGRTENRAARGSADGYPAAPFEAVWHLRVGLNVAALMCKGRGRTPGFGRLRSAAGADAIALSSAALAQQAGKLVSQIDWSLPHSRGSNVTQLSAAKVLELVPTKVSYGRRRGVTHISNAGRRHGRSGW